MICSELALHCHVFPNYVISSLGLNKLFEHIYPFVDILDSLLDRNVEFKAMLVILYILHFITCQRGTEVNRTCCNCTFAETYCN